MAKEVTSSGKSRSTPSGRGIARARIEQNGGLSTKEHILDEATRLFARQGYDRVTVRDIAAATGLSMPTLYHYFGDKENLYREVEAKSYGALRDRLVQAIRSDGNAEDRVRAFTAEMYDSLQKDTVFRNIAVRNLLDPSTVNHKFLVNLSMKEIHRQLSELLNELSPGTGDGMAPMVIMSSILGFVLMEPAKKQLTDYQYRKAADTKREREMFVDFVVSAVLRA